MESSTCAMVSQCFLSKHLIESLLLWNEEKGPGCGIVLDG